MKTRVDEPVAPYISVVVTTRNDDHGGDPLKRLQAFVNTFDAHCRRTGLDAEVVVVEWNPPQDKPSVGSLLRLPDCPSCTYRFIEFPRELHARLKYADVLPLFQMIAKNVGIRRARGEFVVATNIDIIFSGELVDFLATRVLEHGVLYRVDRHDIEPDVPVHAGLEEQMAYCASHHLRVHTRWGSYPADPAGNPVCLADDIVDGTTVRLGRGWHTREGSKPWYRWATDRAELLVRADPTTSVLDLTFESNPYEPGSWFEIAAVEDDRPLMTTRLEGKARLSVPLPRSDRLERRIELVVNAASDLSGRHLPAFERRDAMCYRVESVRLRSADVDAVPFTWDPGGWRNAYEGSAVTLTAASDGLAVATDPRACSYAIEYGPAFAPSTGRHRFVLTSTRAGGDFSIGVLSGDHARWLPAVSVRGIIDGTLTFDVVVDLTEREQFWIVLSNNHPQGTGASRFVVHRLSSSIDPGVAMMHPSTGSRSIVERYPRPASRARTLRDVVLQAADAIAASLVTLFGDRLRYRIVRATPEYQAIEKALRASDEQLRALAPLQYLSDFNAFLIDRRPGNLHVNGCGDFQLAAREHWNDLRGYAEFETFSMNIDGLFSYVANAAGIREEVLAMPIYHLEHEKGSGWSPEGEAILRRRIAERGITWVDASTIYIWAAYMHWLGRAMIFNSSDWGFAGAELSERSISARCQTP